MKTNNLLNKLNKLSKLNKLRKIKIGGLVYNIEYTELEESLGRTEYSKQLIQIDNRQTKEQQEVTLIHEIIHCLNNQRSELETESLAQSLYQIIKDNNF